jgi:hypothetical protein
MKKIIVLIGIVFMSFSFQAEAQNCNQGKKLAQKTWAKFGPWKPNFTLTSFTGSVRKVKRYWNWIVSNSPNTIGPRLLEIDGGNESGTIVGQTKSTFVTPPSFNNRVIITINKYDGRAETAIVICSHGRDGVTQELKRYTFPNDRNGKVKRIILNGVKGKVISVSMKNKSVANKFKFRIKAE